ncbi:MAG: metallophosphoesterase [Paracoccaceae bacterium]
MRIFQEMKPKARWQARMMRGRLGQAVLASNLRFRVQRWQLALPDWGTRPPLRIGVVSDLHWGYRPMTPALVERVKRRLMATAPDMILFLGDLAEGWGLSDKMRNAAAATEALADLHAPLGCFAVLGNHDWQDDAAVQAARQGMPGAAGFLEAAGFTVLSNSAVRPGREDVWLAGLESQQAFKGRAGEPKRLGADDLDATLSAAPGDDPIILLAHEPDVFADLDDPRVVLTLSGHMHAGQIRPFGRALYAPSRFGVRYAYGQHTRQNRHLIVSGGLGCSTIPLRIGIIPEITVIECRGL